MTSDDEIVLPRDFERGKKMYAAALCEACHTVNGVGGNIGPDLSQVGTRFGRNDIIEAIISPSDAISDQYQATLFELHSGSAVAGRVISQDDEEIALNQNPYNPSQRTMLKKSDVKGERPSPASIMPAGLINRLNQDEVIDLIAYLVSNADPEHKLFKPNAE